MSQHLQSFSHTQKHLEYKTYIKHQQPFACGTAMLYYRPCKHAVNSESNCMYIEVFGVKCNGNFVVVADTVVELWCNCNTYTFLQNFEFK